ncbi:MAG: M42 family peptidase, partial [Pseudomonadota bacterium]
HGLKIQRSLMLGGGQDGALLQRSGVGVRTLALGCPLLFMHTAQEHAHVDDVRSYPKLIAALINAV